MYKEIRQTQQNVNCCVQMEDNGYSMYHAFNFSVSFDIFEIKRLGGNYQGFLQINAL